MGKEREFLLKKINELSYEFKVVSTLSILAIRKNDLPAIKLIHENLNNIYTKITDKIKQAFGESIIKYIKNEEFNKLPKELSCVRMIDTYKKFLAYEYLNVKSDNLIDKVILNKMSIEFNPFDDLSFINLGRLFLDEGKFKEAIATISYLKGFSTTYPIYSLSGDIYKKLGRYGEAIENYLTCLRKNKKDNDIIKKLDETYEEALSWEKRKKI